MKYATWTKAELIETLAARGYRRVARRWSKARLVSILLADDAGIVTEAAW